MKPGSRLNLRAPEMEDAPVIYRWENDPETRVVSHFRHPVSAFAIEQYILDMEHDPFAAGQVRLMAETIGDKQVIGHIDLFEIDPVNRRAGVGLLVDEPFRSQGYGSEMLSLLEQWCRKDLNLYQLWCTISVENTLSMELFQKAGYQETGKRLQWRNEGGVWRDEVFLQKIL